MVIPTNEWLKCIVDYQNVPGHFVSFFVSLKMHCPHRERHPVGKISSTIFLNPKCNVVRHASNFSYNQ